MKTFTTKKRKALALLSGGLDSMLAAKMIMEQGIYVEGINFYTGFCGDGATHVLRRKDCACAPRINAHWVAEKLGIKLNMVDVWQEYKKVVQKPRYGYGAHINPCLDCKIFMIGKAKEWCVKNGFDFIVSGEVMGQRPKSQLKSMLPIVVDESGAGDILLRPLCAKHLALTLPECEGWVKRELLGNCSGRSRKAQMALAKDFGFSEYAQPSGGCCFLIDKCFARRMRDLWQARKSLDYSLDDIALLRVGRHLRPKPHFKMIIGREEAENNFLSNYQDRYLSLISLSHIGPLALIDGDLQNAEDINLAAQITARYCNKPQERPENIEGSGPEDAALGDDLSSKTSKSTSKSPVNEVRILLKKPTNEEQTFSVLPWAEEKLLESWLK